MARLAPLADKLLASLAQFTHSMMLAQNHTRRQAPSTHRSRCSLIQRFQGELISLAQNHMPTERHHLPLLLEPGGGLERGVKLQFCAARDIHLANSRLSVCVVLRKQY